MPIIEFPPVEIADEQGLLAIGGDLHHDSLLLAYQSGIFPWPISQEYPLAWFSPPQRGVIRLDDIQISRSLTKFVKKSEWTISFNQEFLEVIRQCQEVHSDSLEGTWITDEIIEGYFNLFHKNFAYSVEVRNEKDQLIGGLYGVSMGHFLSGESMFYKESNASKIALLAILSIVKSNHIPFLDTQMVTPITKSFGAIELDRSIFISEIGQLFNQTPIEFPNTRIPVKDLLKSF
ncbi:leucyl/phenylalanyl-tRNA--protein transferase [Halobacteriovorax sp. ZH4_bin.1]|uniref:leucyl/phenylalanyl-tRNA--protein transferase n=1 Tax=unclassified Halobacteriovorax TaxID=2639665 RepID=UPI003715E63B